MGPPEVIVQEQLTNNELDLLDGVKPPRACMPAETKPNVGISLFSLL